jgi:hypothetical protein
MPSTTKLSTQTKVEVITLPLRHRLEARPILRPPHPPVIQTPWAQPHNLYRTDNSGEQPKWLSNCRSAIKPQKSATR